MGAAETSALTGDLITSAIILIVFGLFIAFFGYKFFRFEIAILGFTTGYSIGSEDLGALVGDSIPGGFIHIVLGLACAILGLFLAYKFCKVLFAIELVYPLLASLIFSNEAPSAGNIILAAIITILVIVFTCLYFRHFYIFVSSVLGMFLAFMAISVFITSNSMIMLYFILAGILLSIIPIKVQLKTTEDAE